MVVLKVAILQMSRLIKMAIIQYFDALEYVHLGVSPQLYLHGKSHVGNRL